MKALKRQDLAAINGGGWLADWGAGVLCGLAIVDTVATAGATAVVAVATCAVALG